MLIEDGRLLGSWMNFLSVYIVPIGALMAGIMFFWVYGKDFSRSEVRLGYNKQLGKWFEPMTRYIFIGITFVVFILGLFVKI